jgi:serine/threonine protein kinase
MSNELLLMTQASGDGQQFLRTVQMLRQVHHPCIAKFVGYSLPTRNATAVFVMKFYPGGSLADVLGWHGKANWFDATARVTTLYQIAMAMANIHDAGFIHRDLSTRCVLFSENYRAKVTGFDKISVTQTMGIGHGYYAAPEM